MFFLVCCLFMSCCTIMPNEKFFCTVSTKDIPDLSVENIQFKTFPMDDHFPECGTFSYPYFDYDIKYDTLSHYKVVVLGSVAFREQNINDYEYEIIDSVSISRLVVDRSQHPRELYGIKGDDGWITKNWEECSLPNKILKKIKKDFLIRMKYLRYSLKKNDDLPIKGMTTSYGYLLYQPKSGASLQNTN